MPGEQAPPGCDRQAGRLGRQAWQAGLAGRQADRQAGRQADSRCAGCRGASAEEAQGLCCRGDAAPPAAEGGGGPCCPADARPSLAHRALAGMSRPRAATQLSATPACLRCQVRAALAGGHRSQPEAFFATPFCACCACCLCRPAATLSRCRPLAHKHPRPHTTNPRVPQCGA